jgi:hypothetical protein
MVKIKLPKTPRYHSGLPPEEPSKRGSVKKRKRTRKKKR